mgnify:CR=1 FL=1
MYYDLSGKEVITDIEDGAWYPVIIWDGQYIARYSECKNGFLIGESKIAVAPNRVTWIGEKLEIQWPE